MTISEKEPVVAAGGPGRGPGLPARRFTSLFLLLATLSGLWAVASPAGAIPDEYMHYKYAYALWSGQVTTDSSSYVVPASLALARHKCYAQKDATAGCSVTEVLASEQQPPQPVATTANFYPPLFYVAAGWTLRLSPDDTGILGGRLVGAVLCSFLVVLAIDRLYRIAGPTTMVSLLLCLTPMAVYFFGGFNPQGIELALALLLVAVTTQLAMQGREGGKSGWVLYFLAAGGLAVGRPFGFLWGPLIVGLVAVPFWMLGHRIRLRLVAVGLAVAMVLGTVWMFSFSVPDPSRTNPGTTLGALLSNSYGRFMQFPLEWVGNFGHLDTPLPLPIPALWFFALGGVLLLGIASTRTPFVVTALLTIPLAVAVALAMEYRTEAGWGWVVIQGRYVLPFVFVFILLLGFAADSVRLSVVPRLVATVVVIWTVIQVWAMLELLRRNMFGQSTNPLTTDSSWHPTPDARLIVAGTLVSVAAFAWLYGRTALKVQGRNFIGPKNEDSPATVQSEGAAPVPASASRS
jgi:uncharacterized membrane protein